MKLNNGNWYNITQVSDITGLSKQVIRKWEQRYQLIQPRRLENGHRVYMVADIDILKKAQRFIEEGYSIKQAAAIIVEQQRPNNDFVFSEVEIVFEANSGDHIIEMLLQEGEKCNEVELSRLLSNAHQMLGLQQFLQEVVVPLLMKVGMAWQEGRWSEYQEAFCSMVVRDYLVQIRRNYEVSQKAPILLGACLPGEQHEIQLHILLLHAAIAGWRTVLIGSSPALGAIESLIVKLQPQVVLLSAMTTQPFELYPRAIKELDDFAISQKDIQFYIGGAGTFRFLNQADLRAIYMTNDLGEILKKS